ncbi:arginine-tRNA-protein transferase [Phycomyces nitens]|nr:arginine-tRNA-protein transferase [Phycomyces nitens]
MKDNAISIVSIVGKRKGDCGYCHRENTSVTYGLWAEALTCEDYQTLIDHGWRRSGHYLYKPNLEASCCPQYTIRLDAAEYKQTKSQRKVVNKFNRFLEGDWTPKDNTAMDTISESHQESSEIHANPSARHHTLQISLEKSSFTTEKYNIYHKYQVGIHKDDPDKLSPGSFRKFLVESPLEDEPFADEKPGQGYGSFHQKYILDGKLIAVAVLDILPKCVSSVYFFYDPEYAFLALGKYSALQEISLVKELEKTVSSELKWYYMGFYIHTCPKMNYKGQFQPSYLLDPMLYTWYPIKQCQERLDKHRFVVFSNPGDHKPAKVSPGWLDPDSLQDSDLEGVLLLLNNYQLVPVTKTLMWKRSLKLRQNIKEYVAAVGHTMAKRLLVS